MNRFEPYYPPAWEPEDTWDVEEEYDGVPRRLEPQ